MTPANLSPTAKARLERQQVKVIEALRMRCGSCRVAEYPKVFSELMKAEADLRSLMAMPTTPRRKS